MSGWVDRHRFVVLALFTAAFFATTLVKARAKPFWHDEIYTIIVSELPSLSTMWTAGRDGLDLAPPLNAIATRLAHALGGVGPVVTRLPPMLGFWTASLIIFVMVRRRANAPLALAAAILPCHTAAYRFAMEARGYGLALGCSAIALYAWSEAASERRRPVHLVLMGVALASAVWSHYFAVLTVLPIGCGELVRAWRRRRVDWEVAAGILVAAGATFPLLSLASAGFGQSGTFWTRHAGAGIAESYGFLFAPLVEWTFLPTAAAVAFAITSNVWKRRQAARPTDRHFPVHEVVAGCVALVLPICGILLGTSLGTGMAPRYVVFSIAGLATALTLAVWWMTNRRSWIAVLLCLTFVVGFALEVTDSLRPGRHTFRDPVQSRTVLTAAVAAHDPVVVASGVWFLQLWHYATPVERDRLLYLADPLISRELTGSDTLDLGYLALSRWTAVRVSGYEEFRSSHREFFVYSAGAHWLLDKLRQDRATIEEEAREPGGVLYRVRFPPR